MTDKTKTVAAQAHSDDCLIEVEIDATPYLREATVKDLKALRDCGWRGDYPADDVYHDAVYAKDEGALELGAYLAKGPSMPNGDTVGFEVICEEDEFMAWLSENRPDVHSELLNSDPEP